MKTINKRHLYSIIKKLVISIENKSELADSLDINPVQVYRWYSTINKRSIPQIHREGIIKYAKSDMICKKVSIVEYKKLLKEYAELTK